MIDPYSLKKAKEDEEDKMLKEVRLPIGQVQTDIPLTCLLFKEYVPRNDQLKMRKLYFSTDTELKSFCERTFAQLLSPATIYFRIGHSALFRK